VLYAEKDFNLAEHPEIKDVPNLQVIKLMQSFKSREFCTERFAWRHYYWCAQEPMQLAGSPPPPRPGSPSWQGRAPQAPAGYWAHPGALPPPSGRP
jgi:hypothetical protein